MKKSTWEDKQQKEKSWNLKRKVGLLSSDRGVITGVCSDTVSAEVKGSLAQAFGSLCNLDLVLWVEDT